VRPCSHYNSHEFSFEDLGGLTIVKCPITNYDHHKDVSLYFLPPDSQQISFAVYAALKASAMQEKMREIRPFTQEFK
jgi:hypothetical protein